MRPASQLSGVFFLAAIRILTACLTAAEPNLAATTGVTSLTPQQWREDLDVLVRDLPGKHIKAFFHTPEKEFRAAASQLRERIPTLDTPAIVLGLARLTSMLRDGHTRLDISQFSAEFRCFPLMARALKDGVVVYATPPDQAALRGMVLQAINGLPAADAIDRVAAFYSWENEATKLARARDYLNLAEILRVAGVISNDNQAIFELADPKTLELRRVELLSTPSAGLRLTGLEITPQGSAKVSFQRRSQALWWEILPESKIFYVRYDRCADDKDRTIGQYCDELGSRLDQRGPGRLIFDLRQNGGGNSALLDPFIARLARRPEFKAKGSLITLIGPGTFSSAQLNAVKLRTRAHSVLIGGPTGQKPNAYGEIKHFELPNSHMKVWYSTKHFVTEPGDPPSTMPDILVEPTVADYLSGRDPALETAVRYQR